MSAVSVPPDARVLVVLPAWNERESLPGVLAEIREHLPDVAVLVVDDGSHDGTAAVARSHGVDVLELPFNLGVGGAMRAGFRYALEQGYPMVVQVDADGQHDPRDVPRIVERLADADIVIGARFAGTGEYEARGPRRWAMRVLAGVLSRVASTRLTDTTSGFRGAGPRAVELFALHYPAEYLGDTVESLVIAARNGLRIEQIGVSMRERSAGRPSQSPLKAAVYLARACLALVISLGRRRERLVPSEAAVV
ncbi:glycosyltransferase family 2 protein [Cellulomonas xiejunii]|uniref:Glycosyltransferase family 2 protein n=1 Tax=Cellulomonas xiejunii TaxID=2968083 RepID=A0ABY5KLA4_9CELL|nr:glycosyltransferase family 2 protein [Cellulomonas xiejunii]MCC2312934.1 glycosyltransferase family 2 protein [Cellulomonas xiejunii]MCC2320196.1 glycosyltransferase family 2 protein [Cellulomonas xiejunii]UUI70503.1 glycosyltransferase family 2 protein [Cellulomonas xiejunii]